MSSELRAITSGETSHEITESEIRLEDVALALPLPQISPNSISIVFVGGAGKNEAIRFMKKVPPHKAKAAHLGVFDTDQCGLNDEILKSKHKNIVKWVESGRLTVHTLGTERCGTGADPAEGRRLAALPESLPPIMEVINASYIVMGVLATGGGTGAGAGTYIAELAKNAGKTTFVLGIMPSLEDRESKLGQPAIVARSIQNICPLLPISNDSVDRFLNRQVVAELAAAGRGPTQDELNDLICEYSLLRVLTMILEIITVTGRENVDGKDIGALILEGILLYFGMYFRKDPAEVPTAEVVVAALKQADFQEEGVIAQGKRAAIWFHGKWPASIKREVMKQIAASVNDPEFHFDQGYVEDVKDGQLWVAMLLIVPAAETKTQDPSLEVVAPVIQRGISQSKARVQVSGSTARNLPAVAVAPKEPKQKGVPEDMKAPCYQRPASPNGNDSPGPQTVSTNGAVLVGLDIDEADIPVFIRTQPESTEHPPRRVPELLKADPSDKMRTEELPSGEEKTPLVIRPISKELSWWDRFRGLGADQEKKQIKHVTQR